MSVKDEIAAILKSKAASELAQGRGREMLDALSKGESFESLANSADLKIISVKAVDRNNSELPAAVMDKPVPPAETG